MWAYKTFLLAVLCGSLAGAASSAEPGFWRSPPLLGRDFFPMMTFDAADTWLFGKGGCPERIEMFEEAGLRVYQHSYRPELANFRTNTSMKSGIVRLSQLLGVNEYVRAPNYRGDWVEPTPDVVRRKKPYKITDFFPAFFASKDLDASRPFMLQLNESRPCQFLRDDGYPLGDRADFEAFREAHPNFLGFRALSEFDGDFVYYGYHLAAKKGDHLSDAARRIRAKFPTRSDGGWRARDWTETCYSNSVAFAFGSPNIWAVTSAICGMQAMSAAAIADGGGNGFMYEATTQGWGPWSMAGAFTRGAARQNRLSFGWYVANWYEGYTRDGQIIYGENKWCDYRGGNKHAAARPHLGASRSLLARQLAYGWLIGASFFCTESWQWLYVDKRDGKYVPSDECRDAEEIYRLSKRVDRGCSYTPLALLVAVDEPIWLNYNSGGLRDRYSQPAVFSTLIPSGARNRGGAPLRRMGDQGCLFNSEFGEMFDVLAPDRGHDTATAVERLRPYAYAFLVGDWFDPAKYDRTALETYVREGGTLVVSADQLQKGYVSEQMSGLALTGKTTPVGQVVRDAHGETQLEGAYLARNAAPRSATVLATDEAGVPLVWSNAVGKGKVLTVACDKCLPRRFTSGVRAGHFEDDHADIISGNGGLGLLKHIFRRIQRKAMPIRVEGDCEWGLNRTKDGWLVWIFNNKGVIKWTLEPERFDMSRTASVEIRLGDVKVVSATDVRTGKAQTVSGAAIPLSVKPGDWRVISLSTR